MIPPPRWTRAQLETGLGRAKEIFRQERLQEPLQAYLDAFERYQGFVQNLLETSIDLTELEKTAIDILTDKQLLEAFRYLAGPPLSQDDLKTLSEAVLSPGRLRADPDMVRRIILSKWSALGLIAAAFLGSRNVGNPRNRNVGRPCWPRPP